jgi:hypothetical protein
MAGMRWGLRRDLGWILGVNLALVQLIHRANFPFSIMKWAQNGYKTDPSSSVFAEKLA